VLDRRDKDAITLLFAAVPSKPPSKVGMLSARLFWWRRLCSADLGGNLEFQNACVFNQIRRRISMQEEVRVAGNPLGCIKKWEADSR